MVIHIRRWELAVTRIQNGLPCVVVFVVVVVVIVVVVGVVVVVVVLGGCGVCGCCCGSWFSDL